MITRDLQPVDAAELRTDHVERFDVVIVGSGAGGAVLAKELSEGGMKVAVVEEGSYHRRHRDLAWNAIRRTYRDRGLTSALGSPIIPVPIGRAFGGTTVINSGTCFRVPEPVAQSWREKHGLTSLDAATLDRIYTRVEREIHVEPSDFKVMSRSNTLIHELFGKLGHAGSPLLRNTRGCDGRGMCAYGCDSGAKQAMDVSYLPKAMKAGAKAFVNARVEEVLTDTASGGAAVGVLAQALDVDGKPTGHRLRLEGRMTILAAGTFHTPALLKRNRLARGNRHLGRHLTLHPATKVFAEFDEEIRGWEGTPQAYYLDTFHGEGIMFEGIFTPPDIVGMSVPYIGPKMVDFLRSYARITSFGFLISDESEGRMVNLPFIGPSFLYSLTQGDTDRIQRGVAFLARAFLKGGAKRVIPLLHGDWELRTEKDLAEFEKARFKSSDVECMAFHPLGTCRMAPDAERGVVSEGNEVFGTPGLYVCDGSVIPSSLGVNPQLTIMALATRLSEKLLGKTLT